MAKLKQCPFCGKEVMVIDGCKGLEACVHFEECENESYTIVCDFNNGGCGASSGYRLTEEEAVEAWNMRSGQDG